MDEQLTNSKLELESSVDSNTYDGSFETARRLFSKYRQFYSIELSFCLSFVVLLGGALINQQYFLFRVTHPNMTNMSDIPVLDEAVCRQINRSTPEYILEQERQAIVSRFDLVYTLCSSVPALFLITIVPTLSDGFGRKKCLLFSLSGSCIAAGLQFLIALFRWPYQLFTAASLVSGLTGGFAMFMAVCFAFISDVTLPTQYAQLDANRDVDNHEEAQKAAVERAKKARTLRIIILEMFGALGVFLASLGSGYLVRTHGFTATYGVVAGLSIFNLLYILLVFPNSGGYRSIGGPSQLIKDSLQAFLMPWKLFFDTKIAERVRLRFLLVMLFFIVGPYFYGSTVKVLFLMNEPLCFNPVLLGFFESCTPVIWILGTCLGMGIMKRLLGMSEMQIISIASTSIVLSLGYMPFCTVRWMPFLQPFIGLFAVLAIPVIRSYMSTLVDQRRQGTLYASIGVIQSSCGLIFTPLFTQIYAASVAWFHGLIFWVQAALASVSLTLALCFTVADYRRKTGDAS